MGHNAELMVLELELNFLLPSMAHQNVDESIRILCANQHKLFQVSITADAM